MAIIQSEKFIAGSAVTPLYTALGSMSQKARGIYTLKYVTQVLGVPDALQPLAFVHLRNMGDIVDKANNYQYPIFARPCPKIPRHGFVDSRKVNTRSELTSLYEEALRNDSQAEMILMDEVKATHNAIYNESGILTIGPSNDGATGGKSAITVNCSPELLKGVDRNIIERGAGVKNCAYVELVRHPYGIWYVTQLRDGPRLSGKSKDYVPSKVTVKRVINALDYSDLLAWETLTKSLGQGDVVHHAGGARSSHFGVHCFDHNIPYVVTFVPQVGQVLEPTPEQEKPDYNLVAQGFIQGLSTPIEQQDYQERVLTVLAALHNSTYFGRDDARLIGIASAYMARLGFAAAHGEYRHKARRTKNRPIPTRDVIYERCLNDNRYALRGIGRIRSSFFNDTCWSGSYGGKTWGNCTEQTMRLWNSAVSLVNKPNEKNYVRLKDALNASVNCVHNNGWWLNKYVSSVWFDLAVSNPALPLLQASKNIYSELSQSITGLQVKLRRLRLATIKGKSNKPALTMQAKKTKLPLNHKPATIINMQARFYQGAKEGLTFHVQFMEKDKPGYYKSFDLPATEKLQSDLKDWLADQPSFSGSDSLYFPLHFCSCDYGYYKNDNVMVIGELACGMLPNGQIKKLMGEQNNE